MAKPSHETGDGEFSIIVKIAAFLTFFHKMMNSRCLDQHYMTHLAAKQLPCPGSNNYRFMSTPKSPEITIIVNIPICSNESLLMIMIDPFPVCGKMFSRKKTLAKHVVTCGGSLKQEA